MIPFDSLWSDPRVSLIRNQNAIAGGRGLRSAEGRGHGAGARGDDLVQCPYDANHMVSVTKIFKHLMNCRLAYQERRRQEEESIIVAPCKYNPQHQIEIPELLYHESTCPDKGNIPSYMFRMGNDLKDEKENDHEELMKTLKIHDEINDDYPLETFVGSDGAGRPVPRVGRGGKTNGQLRNATGIS